MLNKLLKMCMPWQQRGKWVRIYVDWSDTNNPPVVKGPNWLNVSVVNAGHGIYTLSFNPNGYYIVSEMKHTVTSLNINEDVIQDFQKLYYPTELGDFEGGSGYIDMFMQNLKITIVNSQG